MDSGDGGESARQLLKDWADIGQKVVIGICVALVTGLWVARKEQLTGDKICVDIQSATIDTVRAASPSLEEIQARVDWIPQKCDIDRDKFLRLLSELASRTVEAKMAERAGSNIPKTPGAGPSSGSATQKAIVGIDGWVAFGYRSPTAYSETNFDLVSKVSHAAGEPADIPAVGSIVKARWQVNVRQAAADWNNVTAVVQIGQCLKVEDARVLSAGNRFQIWTKVKSTECP